MFIFSHPHASIRMFDFKGIEKNIESLKKLDSMEVGKKVILEKIIGMMPEIETEKHLIKWRVEGDLLKPDFSDLSEELKAKIYK